MGSGEIGGGRGRFVDAAARAMLTHWTRHPNRTIYGGASDV